MDTDALKSKAKELWDLIVKLETERYDLEEKVRRQDYDVDIIRLSPISSKMLFSPAQRIERETKTAEQAEGNQTRT